MSIFDRGLENYALRRHQRPAENFKLILEGSECFGSEKKQENQGALASKLRELKSDVSQQYSAFIDLMLLVFALSFGVYLLVRVPVAIEKTVLPEQIEPAVFSDDLLDLTELVAKKSQGIKLSELRTLIDSENLDNHVQIIEAEQKISLQINSRVLFNDSSYFIARSGELVLAALMPLLNSHTGSINVEVHTNGREPLYGGITTEKVLSKRRAESIFDYLVIEGFKEKSITIEGFGDSKPVVDTKTSKGRVLLTFGE